MKRLVGVFINIRFYRPFRKARGGDVYFRTLNQLRWVYTLTSEFLMSRFEKKAKELAVSFITKSCMKLVMKEKVIIVKNIILNIEKWTI